MFKRGALGTVLRGAALAAFVSIFGILPTGCGGGDDGGSDGGGAVLPTVSAAPVQMEEGNEGTADAVVTVQLSTASEVVAQVSYTTEDATGYQFQDYHSRKGVLEFQPGETSKQIVIPVIGDSRLEGDETFSVRLSDPVGATLGSSDMATVTIQNDDGAVAVPVLSGIASAGRDPGNILVLEGQNLDLIGDDAEVVFGDVAIPWKYANEDGSRLEVVIPVHPGTHSIHISTSVGDSNTLELTVNPLQLPEGKTANEIIDGIGNGLTTIVDDLDSTIANNPELTSSLDATQVASLGVALNDVQKLTGAIGSIVDELSSEEKEQLAVILYNSNTFFLLADSSLPEDVKGTQPAVAFAALHRQFAALNSSQLEKEPLYAWSTTFILLDTLSALLSNAGAALDVGAAIAAASTTVSGPVGAGVWVAIEKIQMVLTPVDLILDVGIPTDVKSLNELRYVSDSDELIPGSTGRLVLYGDFQSQFARNEKFGEAGADFTFQLLIQLSMDMNSVTRKMPKKLKEQSAKLIAKLFVEILGVSLEDTVVGRWFSGWAGNKRTEKSNIPISVDYAKDGEKLLLKLAGGGTDGLGLVLELIDKYGWDTPLILNLPEVAAGSTDILTLSGSDNMDFTALKAGTAQVNVQMRYWDETDTFLLSWFDVELPYVREATLPLVISQAASTVTVTASDPIAAETGPDTGEFTFTLSATSTTSSIINFSYTGTATPGIDYTALPQSVTIPAGQLSETLTLTPLPDSDTNEAAKTVIITLQSGTGYVVGEEAAATVTIYNEEPSISASIDATDDLASESGDLGTFEISLSAPAPAEGITVYFDIGANSTADSGDFGYAPSTSVTFAQGELTKAIVVAPIDDAMDESNEAVFLEIIAGNGYAIGTPSSAFVTIQDDDTDGSAGVDKTISDLGMTLKAIPAGTFTMGSPDGRGEAPVEPDRGSDEGPQHQVTISQAFWMAATETTQAQYEQYEAIIGTNFSRFKGDASRPVENVSWNNAVAFCAELTKREVANIPTGYEYRLPTEAEWEYCCRAGTTTNFSYGQDDSYSNLGDYAWYRSSSSSTTHPVATKLPNDWGLYDMHGNVWEWCHDWYNNTYPPDAQTDPSGPDTGSGRVLRGGSWYLYGRDCRSASRFINYPSYTRLNLGFRVVLAPVLP